MDWPEAIRAFAPTLAAFVAVLLARRTEITKLDTRLEKLDQIEIEVQRVTRAQEEIKHEINNREWKREWKRDAYVSFLSSAQRYALYVDGVMLDMQRLQEAPTANSALQLQQKLKNDGISLHKELAEAYAKCRFVAPEKVIPAVGQLWNAVAKDWNAESWSNDFKGAVKSFTEAIRADLGFDK
jgi:hypothetical protein